MLQSGILALSFLIGSSDLSTPDLGEHEQIWSEHRPSNVPDDFLITPFGYFHPSCLYEIKVSERLDAEDNVVRTNGRMDPLPLCRHSHFDRNGGEHRPLLTLPYTHSWAAAVLTKTQPLQFLSTAWTVPPNPSRDGSQVVFFFPGIQNSNPTDTILQPVLEWNQMSSHKWTLRSWLCCRNGNGLYSSALIVKPGQQILGSVWGTNCDIATGVCAEWQTITSVAGGAATVLNSDSYGEPLDFPVVGAMEGYNIVSCDQYPGTRGGMNTVSFSQANVSLVGGSPIKPAWTPYVWSLTPSCNVNATWINNTANLSWCVPSTCSIGDCANYGCIGSCYISKSDGCGRTLRCNCCPSSQPYHCGYGVCIPSGLPPGTCWQ